MKHFTLLILLCILFLTACTLPQFASPLAKLTAGPSPTPTIQPTNTITPTPLPTATPLPATRVRAGDNAILDGNYPQARLEFQMVLASNTDDTVRAEALWGLGKADYLAGNIPAALENLRLLTQNYPNTEYSANGWFLLGEINFTLERYKESADSYQNYLTARPGRLDSYVQEKLGDAFTAVSDIGSAQTAYQLAEKADGQQNPTGMQIKIANTFMSAGDPASALKIYNDIYDAAADDYLRAQMDLFAGRALIALGRPDEGYDRWRHASENYQTYYDAYSALLGLVDAGQPVDEYNRGVVDFYAGKYDVALAAFQRFESQGTNNDGTVLHYKALCLRELGEYNTAIDTWNEFINNYPENPKVAIAVDEKVFTQWAYLDEYNVAASQLEMFANSMAASPLTVTYLFEAARIYERGGDLEKAALLWESLPDRFVSDASMPNAWFQAGIVRYRAGNYPQANIDFQRALLLVKEPSDRARALLWIGKTYAVTADLKNANSAWEQAQTSDPDGYYSLRARDLLENRPPFAPPPSMNLSYDLPTERSEAAAWLRIKFDLPPETNLSGPGVLSNDTRFQRGTEFWNLGLSDQARVEFESIRDSIKTNAPDSFRLGNYLLDLGLYRPGIMALREVLTIAGLDDHTASLTAPIYFKHARYGLYYKDLIWSAAAENGYDPLFITSIIRQESLFEGFVHSSAGARGLMQIMPATGASISSQMGWPPEYSSDDLYSPYISIRLGTSYLNSNRKLLDGDLFATLAAYNSGPGNASIWQSLAKGDPDLELEIIRYGESRDYIRNIYATYTIYRALYSPMQ